MTSLDVMEKCQMNQNVGMKSKNNLAAAAEILGPDEELLFGMFCSPINRGTINSLFDGALLITTSRIIVCGKTAHIYSSPSVETIAIENFSSVSPRKGLLLGTIVIKTIGNDFINLEQVQKNEIDGYVAKISAAIETAKSRKKNTSVVYVNQQQSPADEIMKYKQLLNEGVITQEEFDAKKKQLLGL